MSSDLPSGLPPEILISDLSPYRTDWWALGLIGERSGSPFPEPAGAVRPRDAAEVSQVLRWASEHRIPVVARGGGSGVCGAAVPGSEAIVVDLTALDRVVEVDETSLVFTAEAGISGPALENVLEGHGMMLGHVPQSLHLSTLGGWISTKATGQLSTRYGGIEDRLLGLTAVLSDGTMVSSKPAPRASTGPDWWRMFLGAEGSLGLVTEATLSAFPFPETALWLSWSVPGFSAGIDLLRQIVHSGLSPSVARLYDEADAGLNFGRLGVTGPMMILRFEGPPGPAGAEAAAAAGILERGGSESLGPEPGEHWWDHRFEAAGAYRRLLAGEGALGPHGVVDTMEVAAFWRGLPQLYEAVGEALSPHADAVLAHASHLYASGANIYFTFLISSADDDEAERRYRSAWEAGMRATLDAGGTISHHHGVGVLKAPWISEELGSGMEMLRRLKAALDPGNIMNPGRLGF